MESTATAFSKGRAPRRRCCSLAQAYAARPVRVVVHELGGHKARKCEAVHTMRAQLAWSAPRLLKVREFESMIGLILADVTARNEQNVPFAIVSISHVCSPSGNFISFPFDDAMSLAS
jgi:hypothetical protein